MQTIVDANTVSSVAVLGNEYIGMKPTMLIEEGQQVKLGQAYLLIRKLPKYNSRHLVLVQLKSSTVAQNELYNLLSSN